jgi:hypothetical protein
MLNKELVRELPYVIISYYTLDTPYQTEIKNLRASLEKFRLPFHIYGVLSRGSWIRNVQINEEIILRAFDDFPGKAIVSLDADAVVIKYPALFECLDCDFAAHYHTWAKQARTELLCSTMYFQNTEITRHFLEDCLRRYKDCPSTRQQPNMQAVFNNKWSRRSTVYRKEMRFINLPPQYCKIFDLMADIKFPVIEQYQASRRFKKLVGK